MARFGFWSISCIMVAEPTSDRSIVDEKSACHPARRRARRYARGRVLAGPGSLDNDRRGGHCGVDLARRTLPLPRNLQGQNRLPLGRRGLSAGVALHHVADQAGADRMGPADVRNRRHQNAAHGARLALRRRRTQSRTDPAARQSDPRHLRRPRLLRRLVPAGPGEPDPFLREERRRHLAAHPQPLVARNRRRFNADPWRRVSDSGRALSFDRHRPRADRFTPAPRDAPRPPQWDGAISIHGLLSPRIANLCAYRVWAAPNRSTVHDAPPRRFRRRTAPKPESTTESFLHISP